MFTSTYKIKSPARICLFGDHQDYLGLPVIACAIDRYIHLEATENNTQTFELSMPDIDSHRSIEIHDPFTTLTPRDYFGSALRVLRRKNIIPNKGFDIRISGNIPINSGLSSSTASSLAWIRFLCKAFSYEEFSPSQLAQLSYQAEVLEHGEPGGMMDQYSIAYGGLIHLTTKKPYQLTKLNADIPGLVIGNSGVEKKTIEVLRQALEGGFHSLEAALELSQKLAADELDEKDLQELLPQIPQSFRPFLRAAIGNHLITQKAMAEFYSPSLDLEKIGSLMSSHQDHLRDNLQVSIPVLDALIDAALGAGALGAKLIGSGGGGCVVALAPGREDEVRQAMLEAGAIDAFRCNVVNR